MNYICKVCNDTFTHHNALTNHLKTHKLNSKTYYDNYLKTDTEGLCEICDNETKYLNFINGYQKHCSRKCSSITSARIQWSGDVGELRKYKLSQNMLNNNLSVGRPRGSKNKNPYPVTSLIIERNRKNNGGHWLGKKHKNETLELMSKIRTESILKNGGTMAFKGRFFPDNPQKYKGDVNNIVWRSTWERKTMGWLDKNPNVLVWSSEEIVIPYRDPTRGHMRRYFVDFYMQIRTKDGTLKSYLLEIKPEKQVKEPLVRKRVTKQYINEVTTYATNQAKWKAATEYCNDRGWEFKILTEKDLPF